MGHNSKSSETHERCKPRERAEVGADRQYLLARHLWSGVASL